MKFNGNTIEAVFFDLDDTLYDQLEPFRNAVGDILPEVARDGQSFPLDAVFRRVRHYSDRLWDQYTAGGLDLEEMRRQRLIFAFEEFGLRLDGTVADALQARYLYGQGRIQLAPGAAELMAEFIAQGLDVGIITNGPVNHQMGKILALKLEQIIPADRIFISDAVGIAKPDPRIFTHISRTTGHLPERCLYIGDAWLNDVTASVEAGWHVAWINRRGTVPDSHHEPGLIVEQLHELLPVLLARPQADGTS
ncbi:HAD family hydrolase [Paenibacillus oenotherae]|uniref:HAD family hydrolase n=1 Tax=Paenibacillus oenotherae TaxID=1435645 RepID=A0ABS7D500_9BACL|nr:HAD family hydrolase [Paenibacillus oenotherae]MBW7474939.1 HAD family hydrolase [Paenibacillus oenotherae]